jgi:hypothetical protein
MPSDISQLPTEWNEAAITRQLHQLRDQKPSMIPHYVESVKERFIVRQDDRTAQVRLRFMQHQIEQLKLAKEYQQLKVDLEILAYEREKRVKVLQLETAQIDSDRENLGELGQLRALKERKKIELELAQLDQQIEGIKNTSKTELRLSPEQERTKRHAQSESRLNKLKEEKQKAIKIDDEQERILKVNAIDDEIQREMVEWSKTLL